MAQKFRLFAGPNGSGKSTLFKDLRQAKVIHTEIYISADSIEVTLKNKKQFYFPAYRIQANQEEFIAHIKQSSLFKRIEHKEIFLKSCTIQSGILKIENTEINSYHASFVATYLVDKLFETKQSFCFETVMSHDSKIELLKKAKSLKYKIYLYFLYTNDVKLNIGRVKLRAQQGEHDVPEEKIKSRYLKSLSLLPNVLELAETAYVFDTSSLPATIVLQKCHNKIEKYQELPKITKL